MLQLLRDKAHGWAAWVIIGIIALSFILLGTEAFFFSGKSRSVVAQVDGVKISAEELDRVYQRYLTQSGAGSLQSIEANAVKKELLDSLIEETIMLKAAQKLGMRVNSQRVANTIHSIPIFQQEGRFSNTAYNQFLANANYTHEGFQNLLRDSLLKQQLQQGLMQTSFALTSEVSTLVKYILQKRDIRYFTLATSEFEKEIKLNEAEINKYYADHLKDFTTDELISLDYVHLSLKNLEGFQPKDEDIKKYYVDNKDQFTDPERVHVAHILISLSKNAPEDAVKIAQNKINELNKKLKEGQAFDTLAKLYSEDKSSASNGGDLQWFEKSEMVPDFEKAAFGLETPGQVSAPVRTQFGFHLIKLIEKQKEKISSLETVRSQIIDRLKEQNLQDQFANMADELTTLAFDHPDTLQPIQDKLGLTIQKTDLFNRQRGPTDKLLQQPNLLGIAFSQSLKDDKNNSDVIKIDDENYVVIRVDKHIPSKQKEFQEVKPEIERLLITQKADVLANTKAQEIYQQILKNKADHNKLMSQYTWQEKKGLARSTDSQGGLVTGAFKIPTVPADEPFKIAKLDNGDYAIFWLIKVEDGDYKNLSEKERAEYQRALAKHEGELEYELYATEQTGLADVKKYNDKI